MANTRFRAMLGRLLRAEGQSRASKTVEAFGWLILFASMLDRPLVPLAMAILWYLNIIPGPLALIFSIQDFGSFLWTLKTWQAE
jgi:hypothetical protein